MIRRSRALLPVALLCLAALAHAASAQGTRLLRDPGLSATHVAFVYANDLWVAARDGGEARRLTSHPGVESDPCFSPDGLTLAFTAEYEGNTDVYTVPVVGGEPTRLTWHPSWDGARGWTPDGKHLVIASARTGGPYPAGRLYTIGLEGGWAEALPMDKATKGSFSPDMSHIAYIPWGDATSTWRGYRGGQTTPVWICNLADLSVREIPRDNSNDQDPMWIGDTVYFRSDRAGTQNLFAYAPDGTVTQLTKHVDYDIKCATFSGTTIVYEQGGYLHLYETTTGEDRQLEINARVDSSYVRPRLSNVSGMIRDGSISPKGARALFEARGEIFSVPAAKGDWRNLSKTPGVHDRTPRWSPDGRTIAWWSERDGEAVLLLGEQTGTKEPRIVSLANPSFYDPPVWSPDSKKIAFHDCHGVLSWLDVESGQVTKIADLVADGRICWSHDSKWIAYSRQLPNLFQAVEVYSLEGASTQRISDGMSDAVNPVFDRGGRYLYFLASTDLGPHTAIMSMNSYTRDASWEAYVVLLRNDDPSPFLPESDEETIEEPKTDAPKPDEPKPEEPTPAEQPAADAAPAPAEGDAPAEAAKPEEAAPAAEEAKPEEPAKDDSAVRIDFEGIGNRVLALPGGGSYGGLAMAGTPDSVFLQTGGTLQRFSLKERKADTFLDGIDGFDLSADGQKLLYSAGGGWGIVGAGGPSSASAGRINTGALEMTVDPRAEWAQIYREVWRIKREFFYDPSMHGENWPAMYDRYLPFLASVVHRADLNYVLEMLSGELVVGHSYGGGGDLPGVGGVGYGSLGADLTLENGRYRLARIFTGESWNPDLRAPLAAPGVKAASGDYLIAINGHELTPPEDPWRWLIGAAGHQVTLKLNKEPSLEGAWDVTVIPIGSEWSLRVKAWVEDNRRKVDEMSQGKLAYVWLPDTTWGGYNYFVRYWYAQQDRQGAVLDERFNGGGHNADYILDMVGHPLDGAYAPRDFPPLAAPAQGIFGPKVMITNRWAGSGGDALPYMFRKRGLGPLIGTRTWGGLVGIGGYPELIDGGSITAPSFAFFSSEGNWAIENEGVQPDIEIEIMPKDFAEGRDPQLERAVAEALKALGEHPAPVITRPAPINRVQWKYEQ